MTQFNDYHEQQPHGQQRIQPQPVQDDPLEYTPIYQPADPADAGSRKRSTTLSSLVAFALLIFAVVLGYAHQEEFGLALGSMRHIGPGHSSDKQTMGLIVVGFIAISILAAVRIFVNNNNDRRDR